jgi:hypothetical protein
MIAYIVPAETIFGAIGAVGVGVIYALIAISRLREQISRLDEWVRQQERRNHKGGA